MKQDETVFPRTKYWDARDGVYHDPEYEGGISLRDYFAAKAMHGILGLNPIKKNLKGEEIAKGAYQLADAMLKERLET